MNKLLTAITITSVVFVGGYFSPDAVIFACVTFMIYVIIR